MNSEFAVGELLRGAAEFVLGDGGAFLFVWAHHKHLDRPPTRIRQQHIREKDHCVITNEHFVRLHAHVERERRDP